MLVRLLIAMTEGTQRERIRRLVDGLEAIVTTCHGEGLAAALAALPVDIVLTDRAALGESGTGEIAAIRKLPGSPEVVLLSDRDAYEERARFVVAGCAAVLYTGLGDDALRGLVRTFIDRRRKAAHTADASVSPRLETLVAVSPRSQHLVERAREAAALETPVLILAGPGSATEALARAIHAASPRAHGAFVAIPGAPSRSPELTGRALVGHADGGHPPVTRAERGLVEMAHRGTLYVDELVALPLEAQRALATLLVDGELPAGGDGGLRVRPDVRLVAATRSDPERALADGRLDRALYDRVRGVVLEIPPLHERREDIPALAQRYLTGAASRVGASGSSLSAGALEALVTYDWAGNDAELEAVMTRAALRAAGGAVGVEHLALETGARPGAPPELASAPTSTISEGLLAHPLKDAKRLVIDHFEYDYLAAHLRATRGRVGATAERAGITPRALYEKMRALGLRKEDFRG